jgi:DNA repair exonuclease SbcCD ATPase subunit
MSKFSDFLAVSKDRLSNYRKRKKDLQESLVEGEQMFNDILECRDIMNIVGSVCQEQTKNVVEDLVSEALKVVFGETHSFEMESKIVRNQPEIYMYVVRNGVRYNLREELGGGVADLVSFVLRIVLWSITTPRSANIMILDEPGKFISKDLQSAFGDIIKELSTMLGIQFIIVSHEQELIATADVTYEVALEGDISHVTRI